MFGAPRKPWNGQHSAERGPCTRVYSDPRKEEQVGDKGKGVESMYPLERLRQIACIL